MKRIPQLTMLTALLALWTVVAWAGAPDSVNFQGRLQDGSGNPVTVATNVAYRIYNGSGGGATLLWGPETHNVTPDTGGLYNVTLGSLVGFPSNLFAGTPRYLGITIAADPEVTPRTQIVSVAYALRVKTVDKAAGGSIIGEAVVRNSTTPDDQLVLGVSDPNVALELRSGATNGTPFIDFVNDNVSDYDARIQLVADGKLRMEAALDVTGDVSVGGNAHISGNLTKDYTVGTPDLAAPIAYAFINADGSLASGTSNVSSVWNVGNSRYEITITGESYSATSYVTVVTPRAGVAPEALFATTNSSGGQLLIRVMSASTGTTGLQKDFQFVTFKP